MSGPIVVESKDEVFSATDDSAIMRPSHRVQEAGSASSLMLAKAALFSTLSLMTPKDQCSFLNEVGLLVIGKVRATENDYEIENLFNILESLQDKAVKV